MKLLTSKLKKALTEEKGSIEILMLLCCLVGVIAFMNFAMGILSLGIEIETDVSPDNNKFKMEYDDLRSKKKKEEEKFRNLEDKINGLERDIAEKEKELDKIRQSNKESARNENVKYRNKLNDELFELEKKINQKKKELEQLRQTLARMKQIKAKEDELKKLYEELEKLERDIQVKKKELGKMTLQVDESLEKDIDKLRKRIAEAEKRKKELEDELSKKINKKALNSLKGLIEDEDVIDSLREFAGTMNISNPLLVECKKKVIKLYPYNRTINISKIERENPFLPYINKHDGIVFIVRPDGLEIFSQSLQHAKKTGLKISYEPVEY